MKFPSTFSLSFSIFEGTILLKKGVKDFNYRMLCQEEEEEEEDEKDNASDKF